MGTFSGSLFPFLHKADLKNCLLSPDSHSTGVADSKDFIGPQKAEMLTVLKGNFLS